MSDKIKLLVAVLLAGGAAVLALAEQTSRTIETNENEWTINHSDKGQELISGSTPDDVAFTPIRPGSLN